jgi:hypothetical protein
MDQTLLLPFFWVLELLLTRRPYTYSRHSLTTREESLCRKRGVVKYIITTQKLLRELKMGML